MKYDFDEIIPRRGTNSVKWDLATDERVLPMWVADMDFRTARPYSTPWNDGSATAFSAIRRYPTPISKP